jgi:hypothetical protein
VRPWRRAGEGGLGQSQVSVCALQMQEAQSPSLEQASPAPNEPGVHGWVVVPPPVPVPVVVGHMPGPMAPGLVHSDEQLASRQAAVEMETLDGDPQVSAAVQAATVLPWYRQPTRHEQFESWEQAWYCPQHDALAQATQASSAPLGSQEGRSSGRYPGTPEYPIVVLPRVWQVTLRMLGSCGLRMVIPFTVARAMASSLVAAQTPVGVAMLQGVGAMVQSHQISGLGQVRLLQQLELPRAAANQTPAQAIVI